MISERSNIEDMKVEICKSGDGSVKDGEAREVSIGACQQEAQHTGCFEIL